jgi:hypothetical protein
MIFHLRIGLFLIATMIARSAEQPGYVCFSRLDIPSYTSIARAARLAGNIEVTVRLDETGSAQDIGVTGHAAPAILQTFTRGMLTGASYRKDCANSTMKVNFVFELRGPESECPNQEVIVI